MAVSFVINDWAGYAPGLATPEQWSRWAARPELPQGELEVALPEMPPLLRRRLSPLGRMAAWAAYRCHGERLGIPVVFASGHGDAARSLALLDGHARGEALSPTDFALSVHNAIGAMYSIARADTSVYSTAAAGAASAAAGLIEALALVDEGAPEALLVCYDAPLPAPYADFAHGPACAYAWAWRIAPAAADRPYMSLEWEPAAFGEAPAAALPFGLEAMRFAASSDIVSEREAAGQRWRWCRHD